jgi:hypothetical protein
VDAVKWTVVVSLPENEPKNLFYFEANELA